jgi:hypothetical protein
MSSAPSSSLSVQHFDKMTAGNLQWLDMDPPTLNKILQIQLEDIEALSSRAKGKQREGIVTDAQFALQVYVEDLATSYTTISDRVLAEDVTKALLGDIPAIEEAARRERQIARDREFAGRLSGSRATPSSRRSLTRKLQRNDSDPLKALWPVLLDSDSDESVVQAESSTWAASRLNRDTPSMRRCVACAEERVVSEVATLPCKYNHTYCRDCLATMFRLAIEDESLFPPKCDGEEIAIDMFCEFLSPDLVEQYSSKSLEFKTKYRTYCHDQSCSAFIPPAQIAGITGVCPNCRKTTCVLCKFSAHFGECSSDEATRQLKETAANEQWQRCYICEQIVQLERGCNHITYVRPWHRFLLLCC